MVNGIEHIQATFDNTRAEHRAALMPYFTAGFPDLSLSRDILRELANSGADLIEVGIPFSDPLADGPTIQRSTQAALENGASLAYCLETVRELRRQAVAQPLILMGYYNPILSYGVERFTADAAKAGVDGLIVPDLPPEEAGELEAVCQRYRLALVFFLAPNSTPERIAMVAARASGFIYLVSLTGVTGARQALPADLEAFIERVRFQTQIPLAVGFGISTPEQARQVGGLADGVIVGSALINAVEGAAQPCQAAGEFIAAFRAALAAK
jgi:tryptophan synthase alpha chain